MRLDGSRVLAKSIGLWAATWLGASFGHGQGVELQALFASDGQSFDEAGTDVGIDGEWAIVGAPFDDDVASNSGAVYVHRWDSSAGQWLEFQKLTASDGSANSWFGWSVAISGETLIVGARQHDAISSDAGSAYVFEFDGSGWVEAEILVGSQQTANDEFGVDVALDGDIAAVGAWLDDHAATNSGAVYVFERSRFGWQETALAIDPQATDNDNLGLSVSVDGELVVSGAHGGNGTKGQVLVFRKSGGSWPLEQILQSADPLVNTMGRRVAADGDLIVAGTWATDATAPDSGAAYLFRHDGSQWQEEATLLPSHSGHSFYFGSSVATQDGVVMVGAPGENDPGQNYGTLYTFRRCNDGSWVEDQRLASLIRGNHEFAWSVAVNGSRLICGAPRADQGGTNLGAAYVFSAEDLELIAEPTVVTGGDTLTLTSVYGRPSSIVMLSVVSPFYQTLLLWRFAGDHRFVVSGDVPPGIQATVGFQSYEINACGKAIASNVAWVDFQ